MRCDWGPTGDDYAAHRPPFAPPLFERLRDFRIGLAGQTILDLGAGTGLFARALSNSGAMVVLLDASERIMRHSDMPNRIAALAERLPFADESFDVVTAAQSWHWFDRYCTPLEIMRVLRPDGAFVAAYQMYVPLPQSIAHTTEQLILKFNPGWRHANSAGINGQVLRDMQAASFVNIESFTFDVEIKFTREAWKGYIRATSPVGASMTPSQIRQFDQEHEEMLNHWPETFEVPHRIFTAIARKPSTRI